MTEQNRIKLMQLAQKHGFKHSPVAHYVLTVHSDDLIAFANDVLEMAAIECEKIEEAADAKWEKDCDPYDQGRYSGAISCYTSIRDLKGTN